jgi:hypothetical protein
VQAGFHQAVSLKVLETSPPASAGRADFIQAGGLHCFWGSSGSEGLQLSVVSDAAANYAARVAKLTGSGYQDDTLGDDSHVKCTVESGASRCAGDILVDGYWVAAVTTDTGATTAGAAFSAYGAVLAPIVDEIASAAPPRGAWVSPTLTDYDGRFLCGAPEYPAAVLISGTNGFTLTPAARDTATQGGLMSTRAGSTGCTWTLSSVTAVTFATLPGGAWAYERMADAGVGTPVESDFDGSLVVCGDRCITYISFLGALITVVMPQGLTVDEVPSHVQEFAAALGV